MVSMWGGVKSIYVAVGWRMWKCLVGEEMACIWKLVTTRRNEDCEMKKECFTLFGMG